MFKIGKYDMTITDLLVLAMMMLAYVSLYTLEHTAAHVALGLLAVLVWTANVTKVFKGIQWWIALIPWAGMFLLTYTRIPKYGTLPFVWNEMLPHLSWLTPATALMFYALLCFMPRLLPHKRWQKL